MTPHRNDDQQHKQTFSTCPENIEVGIWIRFLRELGLSKLFGELPDPRRKTHLTYPLPALLMWAFSVCAFRLSSKHAMQTSLDSLPHEKRAGIQQLLGSPNIPHSCTVDEALARIDCNHFNLLFLQLLDRLIQRHFFYNHLELLPDNCFYIGADGYWTHTYTIPHAKDDHGNNICPYCLPRRQKVGTEKETLYWVHVCVTFTLICEGITLPLYVYPLKASQVNTDQTDLDLKQECELLATKAVLPLLRQRYPRLRLIFLGDALYANRPFIRFCNDLNLGYIIVLKENTLKTLHRHCEELAKTELYQKSYRKEEVRSQEGKLIYQKAAWFNQADAGESVYTHVLRFEEIEEKTTVYRGAWICSDRISAGNCFKRAQRGRSRWNHEDLHNTCKNRGLDAKHDMARASPNLLWVWKMLLLLAFFVSEIFRSTTLALHTRQKRSVMQYARDLFHQLLHIAWEEIARTPILQKPRVQFRFHFGLGP